MGQRICFLRDRVGAGAVGGGGEGRGRGGGTQEQAGGSKGSAGAMMLRGRFFLLLTTGVVTLFGATFRMKKE